MILSVQSSKSLVLQTYSFIPAASCGGITKNKYKEDVYEEKKYDSPSKYLDKVEDLEKDILEGVRELKTKVKTEN